MSDGFNHFERFWANYKFSDSIEAMEAKADVLMADAIEAMNEIADGLVERDEPRIPASERLAACVRTCIETFDRLERENKAHAEEWQRRYGRR